MAIVQFRTDLWDFVTGKHLRELLPRPFAIAPYRNSIFFSRDGRTILMASSDKTLASWDVATGKKISTIYTADPDRILLSLLGSPDGKQLVLEIGLAEGVKVEDGHFPMNQLQLWDLAQGKLVRSFQKAPYHKRGGDGAYLGRLAIAPDGKTVAAADQVGTIVLWDMATGEIRRESLATNPKVAVATLAFSTDSRSLLSSDCRAIGGVGLMSWSTDEYRELSLRIRDAATGKERFSIRGESGSFTLSPDGRIVAISNGYDSIGLYELLTGRELLRFRAKDSHPQQNLAFTPNCKTLVSTIRHNYEDFLRSYDEYVLIWDVTSPDWRPSTTPLSTDKLLRLWDTLTSDDPAAAYRSVLTLSTHPEQTLPFLTDHLTPIPIASPERIRRLIADLDGDEFKQREAASRELARLGSQAESALRAALTSSPSLELRFRVESLLKFRDDGWVIKNPETLRSLRAIWALQRIGTPEARSLLEKLAAGAPAARQTQDAKATLQFLDRFQHQKNSR